MSAPHLARKSSLILLALLFTALDSVKPLHMDDTAYYYYAARIAHHPLDPYGFEVFWYQKPEPANDVLAPPLLPYWWAAAIRLFGDRPLLWKIWLLPFSLLFVFSLDGLFRRFARGLEAPLVWMTVLSPTFLPSLNLMLDVPALALSLFALTLFFRASDTNQVSLAIGAGLVAGLAMETKYTSFLTPAIMLLYSVVVRLPAVDGVRQGLAPRLRTGLIAAVVAAAVFVSWEAAMTLRYGESHFVHELHGSEHNLLYKLLWWTLPLFTLLGGVNSAGALLGLAALRRRCRVIVLAGAIAAAGYLLIACFRVSFSIDFLPFFVRWDTDSWIVVGSMEQLVFFFLGVAVTLITGLVALSLLRVGRQGWWRPRFWRGRRVDRFLVLWLGLEIAGYFAMIAFGAVRRIMGIVVVATLLIGRLAAITCRSRRRVHMVRAIASAGIGLGVLFYVVDLLDAWAAKTVAEGAALYIREHDPGARIWYVGHWGFQFYAERAGMRPVIPAKHEDRRPLRRGDWLVVPDARLEQQRLVIDPVRTEPVVEVSSTDRLPLRTVQGFYGTSTGVPLLHQRGPRASATVYRVIAHFVPRGREENGE